MTSSHGDTNKKAPSALVIGALGVVFGDIGTSPLYAFKQSIEAAGGVSQENILAILSLMIWSLLLVVTLKYVLVIMRADNRGEGGTLALTALALDCVHGKTMRWIILCAGLIGASLFYGDSVITPAISVLSAMEGLEVATPIFKPYVIPVTMILIFGLFAIERHGTDAIGRLFGPVMVLWFVIIGLLGLIALVKNFGVLMAFDPRLGVRFIVDHPGVSTAVLGAVVLTVTGGEALYADMGHFGKTPINRAWIIVVLPSLLLNYLGQGALLLQSPEAIENPFYKLAPDWLLLPMVVLAAAATIIASQAVISGAFSITNQAVQLGYIPRIRVRHTSADEIGQVYVSQINIFLLLAVEALVITFQSSDSLGAAYGIAVTGTMATVTLLAAIVMIRSHKWNPLWAVPMFTTFFIVDVTYFGANLVKFMEGGWFPVMIAAITFAVMMIWINGRTNLLAARWKRAVPLDAFLDNLPNTRHTRVEGTAIFMVPNTKTAPASLINNMRHSRIIHDRVILMNVVNEHQPYVKDEDRLTVRHLRENFHIVTLHYGFFEEPRILRVLAQLRIQEFHFKLADVSFFIGREKIVSKSDNPLKKMFDEFFITMHRNMLGATEYYQIPIDHVVEVGGITKMHDDD